MPHNSRARSLNTRLLAAHHNNDRGALIALYQDAAQQAADENAQGFYLTQAYIFALEAGDPAADRIKSRLVALKRDY